METYKVEPLHAKPYWVAIQVVPGRRPAMPVLCTGDSEEKAIARVKAAIAAKAEFDRQQFLAAEEAEREIELSAELAAEASVAKVAGELSDPTVCCPREAEEAEYIDNEAARGDAA